MTSAVGVRRVTAGGMTATAGVRWVTNRSMTSAAGVRRVTAGGMTSTAGAGRVTGGSMNLQLSGTGRSAPADRAAAAELTVTLADGTEASASVGWDDRLAVINARAISGADTGFLPGVGAQ